MVEHFLSDEHDLIEPQDQTEPSRVEHALAKLSSPCRAVLDHAYREANAGGSSHLSCEHLLLGLAAQRESAAGRLLTSISYSVEEIRARLGFVQGENTGHEPNSEGLPLSPRIERVMIAAEKDSAKRAQSQIGTLQLLSALLAEREGIAVFVLEEPGVGLERLGAALQTAYREKWEE